MSVFAIARQAGLALALTGLVAPLAAAPVDTDEQVVSASALSRSTVVRFADLDLHDRGDQLRLERRISVAAAAVCGAPDATLINDPADARHCHDRAVDNALAALPRAARLAATGGTSTLLR